MRISNALACAMLAFGIGVAGPAFSLDKGLSPDMPPAEALRVGLSALKVGDVPAALQALTLASDKGLVSARWKLAEMYASGDGVERDDYKAFQLFSGIANTHADDSPRDAYAPYVSNAFVHLAGYFRTGIAGSPVRADMARARAYFTYAAAYFSDGAAQLGLARMLYYGEGGPADAITAARWANLSADKGNPDAKSLLVVISLDVAGKHMEGVPSPYDVRQAIQWAERAADYGSTDGQALYGKLLFDGDGIMRQPVEGLMYLYIALARSGPEDKKVRDMAAAATAKAMPEEVAMAQERADDWLKKNSGIPAGAGVLTQ